MQDAILASEAKVAEARKIALCPSRSSQEIEKIRATLTGKMLHTECKEQLTSYDSSFLHMGNTFSDP